MNIYIIHNKREHIDYDTYRSVVVIAESIESAISLAEKELSDKWSLFVADTTTSRQIGYTDTESEKVIHKDFLNG